MGFRQSPERYCLIYFFVFQRRMTPFAAFFSRLGTLGVGEVGDWRGIIHMS